MRSRLGIVAGTLVAMVGLSACGVSSPAEVLDAQPIDGRGDLVNESPASTVPDTTTAAATTSPPPATTVVPTSTAPPIAELEIIGDVAIDEVVNVGEAKPPADADEVLAVSIRDIDDWWTEEFPALYGEPYEPLAGDIYAGYPDRVSEIPGCGTSEPTDPNDLSLYVAFYCEYGDFMAYDASETSLLTELANEYGASVMSVVMAHEWGHAIQARIGAFDQNPPTIYTEQQADCFAGAWVGRVSRGESDLIRFGDRDVRTSLVAMLSVRDPVGTNQFEMGGHGSAFDRVGAFQEGFTLGAERCVPLLDEPLPLMPNQFQPLSTDELLGGNAPYVCTDLPVELRENCVPAPEFLGDDLNDFWATELGEFPVLVGTPVAAIDDADCSDPVRLDANVALCPANRTVIYAEPEVVELYREFGDFTLGYLYGIAWAEMALREREAGVEGEARALLRDCLTGAWVADITPNANGETPRSGDRDGDGLDDGVSSSPGDLDEAIRMAILVGDEGANVNAVGSPFEKIDWFRNGVLANPQACYNRAGIE